MSDDQTTTSFGYWVRRRRQALDLTQAELAGRVGCATVTISKIEQDVRRPSVEVATLLANQLGIPADETDLFVKVARAERSVTRLAVSDKPIRELDQSPARITHDLPTTSEPIIGRERELSDLKDRLIAPAVRMVTVQGPGGIGKSRLLLALMDSYSSAEQFPDGMFDISLAEIDDSARLPRVIAAKLNVPIGAYSGEQALLKYLAHRKLLLLLDNYEHLAADVDLIIAILQTAPGVKLLVTSQVRLNLREEHLYPLGGLATSGGDGQELPAAQQLFAQAAKRASPTFLLTQEMKHVTAICRDLEGLPLAIELAAGWTRLMSCKEIAAEIRQSSDVLTSRLRDLPRRHQSMQALLERTWLLLSAEEQSLTRKLAVFQGGFNLTAARSVSGISYDSLMQLLDWSVLRKRGEGRFDMHGLMLRFAREKLALDHQEELQTRNAHANHYANLVTSAGWELEPGSSDAAEALAAETANVMAAWAYGIEQTDRSIVERMMRWLLDYYRKRSEHLLAQVAYRQALDAFEQDSECVADNAFLGSLHLRLSKSYGPFYQPEAIDHAHEAVRLLRAASPLDQLELAQALVRLGLTASAHNRDREGTGYLVEAIEHFRAVGSLRGLGAVLRDWGILAWDRARMRLAQAKFEESIELLDGLDSQGHAQSLFILGYVLTFRGHYARAEALAKQALPVVLALEERHLAMFIYRNLGDLYVATGDFDDADYYFQKAYIHFEQVGAEYEVIVPDNLSPGVLARLRGDIDAERQLAYGVEMAKKVKNIKRTAISQHHLAVLWHDQGRYGAALALLDEANEVAHKSGSFYAIALVQVQRARTMLALSQLAEAKSTLSDAIELSDREGLDRVVCTAVRVASQLFLRNGDTTTAIEYLAFAQHCEFSEWETKKQAREALSQLQQESDAATYEIALKAGRDRTLTTIVDDVLDRLQ